MSVQGSGGNIYLPSSILYHNKILLLTPNDTVLEGGKLSPTQT